jgi:hypothetical protein
MAITGAAAIGAVAAGVAGVSTTTILVAGLAITAVGYVTNSSLLKKIGGGMSLGAGVSGVAAGLSGAAGAGDAATSGMAAASPADVAGAGSQAAGNVAEATTAAATDTSAAAASAADTAGVGANTYGFSTGLSPMTDGAASQFAVGPLDSGAAGLANSGVNTANSGLVNQSINDAIAQPGPNASSLGQSSGAANTNPFNSNPVNVNEPNTIAANTNAASPVAPGSQSYGGVADGSSASGGPVTGANGNAVPGSNNYGFTTDGTPAGSGIDQATASMNASVSPVPGPSGTYGMQSSMDTWNQFLNKMQTTWGDLSQYTKNGVFQTTAGLAQGLGQGALSMLSASKQQQLLKEQQDYEHANMSAAAMPTVNIQPGTTNPYLTKTGTFTGATPSVGLINKAATA